MMLLILGGGSVTQELYLPALKQLNWLGSTTIADPSQVALDRLGALSPALTLQCLDYASAIAQAPPGSAVVVALPNWLHEPATRLALRAGHHVLCEKPLALNQHACLDLHQEAEQAGRVLMVGMVRRWVPAFRSLQQLISGQSFGKIQSITFSAGGPFQWSSDTGIFFDVRAGGVLADMGVHFLDQLSCLVGPLTPIRYHDDADGGVEANADFELESAGGIPVRMILSRTRRLSQGLRVVAEGATLSIPNGEMQQVKIQSIGANGENAWKAECELQQAFPDATLESSFLACFAAQFTQFAQAIEGAANYVTAKDAAHVVGLIEWAYGQRQPKQRLPLPQALDAPTLITGATGFIGRALVEHYAAAGLSQRLTLAIRSTRSLAPIARFAINTQRVDLMQRQALDTLMQGQRYVIHLAVARDGPDQAAMTVEGTKRLVEAAISAGVECVVLFSTLYVYGFPEVITEETPPNPYAGVYAKSKLEMLNWVRERAKSSGKTRLVVLTPSYVYGPGSETFTKMAPELARAGQFALFDEGRGRCNYVYIDNVVRAIFLALLTPQAHGEEFLLNDGTSSWKDFFAPVFSALKLELKDLSPSELVENAPTSVNWLQALNAALKTEELRGRIKNTLAFKLAAPTLRAAARSLKKPAQATILAISKPKPITNAYPNWLPELFNDKQSVVRADKARQMLQWASDVSLAEGQKRSVAWLRHIFAEDIQE